MNIFQNKETKLSSGLVSNFKIECDALTDEDWVCLAQIVADHLVFRDVISVPTGGDKFAKYLKEHIIDEQHYPILICDDVLTTGGSMEKKKKEIKKNEKDANIIGVVAFSRGEHNKWITPVFEMNSRIVVTSNPKRPKYVKMGDNGACLVWVKNDNEYWKPNGHWGVGASISGSRQFSKSGMKQLNGIELFPCTRREFLMDNEGIYSR